VGFTGEFTQLSRMTLDPVPPQRPRVPVWLGGWKECQANGGPHAVAVFQLQPGRGRGGGKRLKLICGPARADVGTLNMAYDPPAISALTLRRHPADERAAS
jgi:hypothetical protein